MAKQSPKRTVDQVFAFASEADLDAQIQAFKLAHAAEQGQELALDSKRELGARGEPPHDTSLGLSDEGFVTETCSTPGTAAFRLRALAENPGARSRDGFHHGLLGPGKARLSFRVIDRRK